MRKLLALCVLAFLFLSCEGGLVTGKIAIKNESQDKTITGVATRFGSEVWISRATGNVPAGKATYVEVPNDTYTVGLQLDGSSAYSPELSGVVVANNGTTTLIFNGESLRLE